MNIGQLALSCGVHSSGSLGALLLPWKWRAKWAIRIHAQNSDIPHFQNSKCLTKAGHVLSLGLFAGARWRVLLSTIWRHGPTLCVGFEKVWGDSMHMTYKQENDTSFELTFLCISSLYNVALSASVVSRLRSKAIRVQWIWAILFVHINNYHMIWDLTRDLFEIMHLY